MKNIRALAYRWLRASEKYLKTDMVYLVRGGWWLFWGNFALTVFSFILAVSLANLLPLEDYGVYKYIISIAGIIGAFTLSGLDTAITQAVSRGFEGILKQSFWVSLKWSVLPFIISLVWGIYYLMQHNYVLALAMGIISLAIPLTNATSYYGSFLNGLKKFREGSVLNIINGAFPIILLLVALYFTKSPLVLVIVYLIANTFSNIVTYLYTIKKFQSNDLPDDRAIRHGQHLSFMNIFSNFSGNLDKILLFHFLGGGPLAVYSIAVAPVTQLRSFFKLITPLATPKIAAQQISIIKAGLYRKMFIILVLMIMIIIVYALLIPYFFKLFFRRYLGAIVYSQIFAVVLLFIPLKLASTTLLAHASKKVLYFQTISSSTIRIIALLIFLPWWGILGAIIAQLVNHLVDAVIAIYFVKRLKRSAHQY